MKTSTTHFPSLLGMLLFTLVGILALVLAATLGTVELIKVMGGGQIEVRETILIVVAIFEALLLLGAGYVSLSEISAETFGGF